MLILLNFTRVFATICRYSQRLRLSHQATPPTNATNMKQKEANASGLPLPGIPPRLTPNSPVKKVVGRKTIAISDMV